MTPGMYVTGTARPWHLLFAAPASGHFIPEQSQRVIIAARYVAGTATDGYLLLQVGLETLSEEAGMLLLLLGGASFQLGHPCHEPPSTLLQQQRPYQVIKM